MIMNILLFLAAVFIFPCQSQPKNNVLLDGPYVFEQGKMRQAFWICNDNIVSKEFAYQASSALEVCGRQIILGDKAPAKSIQVNYQGDFDIAAVSDIHGQFSLFKKLLTNNKIIDTQGHWNFGNGHFVITGDVFDRGEQVTEALWFLYTLEQQAREAGGRVHLLLGNHEVMILNGDLRYLNDKYVNSSLKFNKTYNSLFAKNSVLGDWLRSRPVLVKVNNMLFAHGGFHPDLVKGNRSLSEINEVFTENLVKSELNVPRDEFATYLHKRNGPIWYRGYFLSERATYGEIDQLLKHFSVDHLVVGHTSQKIIETRYDGKVIAIDASMKKGQYGEVLLSLSGSLFRGTLSGKRLSLINNDKIN
jgi:hypothetical protein